MPRSILWTFCLFIFVKSVVAAKVRYNGYRVYQVFPSRPDHLNLLTTLAEGSQDYILFDTITPFYDPVHVLVSPGGNSGFLDRLFKYGISCKLVETDFQKIIDTEQAEFKSRSDLYDWTGYHTLNETYKWLESLVKTYSDKVEMIVGGQTFEGRQIRGVKLSFGTSNKLIFLEGGIHACEWISPATVTYLLNEILTNKNPKIRAIVEKFNWYIFPHYNPDGYVYTHTTDRLWRKTRSKGRECDGADPNRNWGFKWMEAGASNEECSRSYGGKSEFSEKETKTLSEFLLTLKGKLHTYVSFHSYGQVLVYPYAGTEEQVPNHGDLQKIGEATVDELSKRYGSKYKVGSTYEVIYPAAGSSSDWAYSVLDVPVVFTYELRPLSSSNGFILPSSQIVPTGQEVFDSLIGMISKADDLGYYS